MDIITAAAAAILALPLGFILHRRYSILETFSRKLAVAFLTGFAFFVLVTPKISPWPRKAVLIGVVVTLIAANLISLPDKKE